MSFRRLAALALAFALVGGACSDQVGGGRLDAEILVDGLDRPTQLVVADDGTWLVAQLAGAENDGLGQILRIDPAAPDAPPVVVRDNLDKPTGIAVFAGELWVMERNRLSRSSTDGTDARIVIDDMVFNGRSQSTLTVDGDRLLFATSGRTSERTDTPVDPATSSGVLWAIDADEQIEAVAWGFKNAYAQARVGDTLYTTELADGTFDGQPAVDELVAIEAGVDHGWPRCVGDNRPVADFGATDATCAEVPPSIAVFAVGATPTGLVPTPWDAGQMLVTRWNPGDVVVVPLDGSGSPRVVWERPDAQPHTLVADGDRVLVVDHAAGEILAIQPD